jgi:hypothetical protein
VTLGVKDFDQFKVKPVELKQEEVVVESEENIPKKKRHGNIESLEHQELNMDYEVWSKKFLYPF